MRNLPQPPRLHSDNRTQAEDHDLVRLALDRTEDILVYLEQLKREVSRQLPDFKSGSAVFNPSNLADGAGETTTVSVLGSVLGDIAFASFSLDLQGMIVTAWVSAVDVVSVRFQNETGAGLNLASGTLTAWSLRPLKP